MYSVSYLTITPVGSSDSELSASSKTTSRNSFRSFCELLSYFAIGSDILVNTGIVFFSGLCCSDFVFYLSPSTVCDLTMFDFFS